MDGSEPPQQHDLETEPLMHGGAESGTDGASAAGVPFAYEVAVEEIARQEAAIREVNARLGLLLAATLTFASFYFKETAEPWRQIVFGTALVVVLALLLFGYIPRTHLRAPNPRGIASEANNRPGRIKELALGTLLQAFDKNAQVIAAKNRYYAIALVVGVLAVLIGVVAEVRDGVIHLRAHDGRRQVTAPASRESRATGHARSLRAPGRR